MSDQTALREHSSSQAVSVLVVTWNRPEAFKRCLSSLASQSSSWAQCELVVLDVSDHPVEDIAASFADILPIKYHRARNQGVSGNRNAAARIARGDLLLLLDDDCVAGPGWLGALRSALARNPAVLAAARVEHGACGNAFVAAGQAITDLVHAYYNPSNAPARFAPGLNFGLERDRFFALGGFDLSFDGVAAEDRDFVHRWLVSGGQILIVDGAQVKHDHRATFVAFVRQYESYGRGAWRFHRKWRKSSSHPSTLRELGLHGFVLMRLPNLLAGLAPLRRLQLLALLAVWQIANAIGFVREAASEASVRARGTPRRSA